MDANAFADEWIDAWNTHDLERILEHYGDDVTFVSPNAARVVPESGGVIIGKDALRSYWERGLAQSPELHFVLDAALETIDGMTILYTNHRHQRVAETMMFDGDSGLVRSGIAAYGPLTL